MPAPWTPDELARLFALQQSDGLFERLIEDLYRDVLKPGDHAVDGGAHEGLHTLPMSLVVGHAGRIEAFEPLPLMARALRTRTAARGNVTVHEAALGDHDGRVTFHSLTDEPWLSSLAERDIPGSPRTEDIAVELVRLDSLADRPIRFIKLDLEGGEFHALTGGQELLRRQSPVIAFECGRIGAARQFGYTSEAFFALFAEVGYGLISLFGLPFTTDDFQRGWDDRVVPHYLVAGPLARMPELTRRMTSLTSGALGKPDWRWRLGHQVGAVRPRIANLPGARSAYHQARAIAERRRR
jgi:FkbM family methyltransferase